jgi:hypothetical protein
MSGIKVSLPALDELSARVLVAGSDTRAALGTMQLNACIDAGDAQVSAALDEFSQFWQGAVKGAGQAIDQTGSQMSAAAQAYGQVDSTVMVDPSLTSAFASETLSGNGGEAALLLGPLLPGGG